jgi:phage shock protein PspC (stress-responsive transcriptional regulator)
MEKKLLRDPYNRILGGVSSGLAHFWGLDTSLIRVAWVGLTLIGGLIIPAIYLVMWIIVPKQDPYTVPESQPRPSRLGTVAKGCGLIALFVLIPILLFIGLIVFYMLLFLFCGIQNAIDIGTFSLEQFFNIQ